MKCFYHREQDAAGTCSQCGKAACHDCLEDVGRAMLCRGCFEIATAEVEEEQAQQVEDQALQVEAARKRLRWAPAFCIVGAIVGFGLVAMLATAAKSMSELAVVFVLAVVFGVGEGYVFWGVYWVFPVVWRWWNNLLGRSGCVLIANPVTWFILTMYACMFLWVASAVYGAFGGGFLEQRKCARLARGQSAPS